MGAMASQITSPIIVYSTVHSGANQRKYQSSASLTFVRGIHRWPVNSPHKWPVTRTMFPGLMTSSWVILLRECSVGADVLSRDALGEWTPNNTSTVRHISIHYLISDTTYWVHKKRPKWRSLHTNYVWWLRSQFCNASWNQTSWDAPRRGIFKTSNLSIIQGDKHEREWNLTN